MALAPVAFSSLCCKEPRNGFSPSGDERLDFERSVQILQSLSGTLASIKEVSMHVVWPASE